MKTGIRTEINLGNFAVDWGKIPEKVMKDIGLDFRKDRNETMKAGLSMHDLSPQTPLKPATIARKRKKGYAQPETPLIATNNMALGTNIEAKDGELILTQGPTRAAIAVYHQDGMGNNPQRVHFAFNDQFLQTKAFPRIIAHYRTLIRKAKKGGTGTK